MYQWVTSKLGPGWSHTVQRVVLLNSLETGMFLQLHQSDNASRAQNRALSVPDPDPSDVPAATGLARLQAAYADPMDLGETQRFTRVVLGWHGVGADLLTTVCETGPRNFRDTDAGFFGAGSYFALEGEYASRYSMGGASQAGECGIILYAVSLGQTHIVTVEGDYRDASEEASIAKICPTLQGYSRFYSNDPHHAIALAPKCDSHFVPVKHYGNVHPRTGVPVVGADLDYQAVSEHTQAAVGHEIVILSHFRCVPLAIVYFV
jgi:hypothetical protein